MTATLLRASLRHLARHPWESALSILEIALGVAVVVFLPNLLLGMVPPVAIKLTLGDLGRVGSVVGRVYAASTVGTSSARS